MTASTMTLAARLALTALATTTEYLERATVTRRRDRDADRREGLLFVQGDKLVAVITEGTRVIETVEFETGRAAANTWFSRKGFLAISP